MADDYPYMVSNNKIQPILDKISQAAVPAKFTNEFLKKLGFSSSNDRAIIPVLKRLGFISDTGTPTEDFARLKDKTQAAYVLGEKIRELYSDLFALNTDIYKASDEEVKGAMSRITGKDAKSVARYFATFKTLTSLAKFDGPLANDVKVRVAKKSDAENEPVPSPRAEQGSRSSSFHYNIQIHLPATSDVSVYNAIFKSLKDNLMI